ncbi:MAG TPA: hypothetical protein VIK83_03375 [Coriobacteriia bacterium]
MPNTYTVGTHTFALDTAVTVAGLATLKGGACAYTDHITGGDHLTVESDLTCASIDVMPTITAGTLTVNGDALAAGLCTLADVYPFAGVSTDTNGALARLILAVSRAVRLYTGLTFGPVVTEERVVRVDDTPTAYPRELRDFASAHDSDGAAITVVESDVDSDGHIRWLDLTYPMSTLLSVTGEWGWSAIPEDVIVYTAQAVADWYKRDQGVTMNALGDLSGDMTRRTRLLPPYVAEGLEHYCRRGI